MKWMKLSLLLVCIAMSASLPLSARDTGSHNRRIYRDWIEEEFPVIVDPGAHQFTESAADTYCIVWFDFDSEDWQGWTQFDKTAQPDTFSHVDDFSGLAGGDFGGLQPIEGLRSLWCGTRPGSDIYLCSWAVPPGYGNNWNQMLTSDPFSFAGSITFSYHGFFSSEPDYDITYVEYDGGQGTWQEIDSYDAIYIDTIAVHELFLSQAQTKLRFHFTSDGAWSDQDGLWNSDGAFVVDSITIADLTGTLDYEDFEAASYGDKIADGDLNGMYWRGGVEPGFGIYSGLRSGISQDKDPCGLNLSSQIMFFKDSPYVSSSYPGLFDTPFCAGPGGVSAPCQHEGVMSPFIDMTRYSSSCDENQDTDIPSEDLDGLGGTLLRFTVYRDNPLSNLVFYTWEVREIYNGCPGQWQDRNYVYYGPDMDYLFQTQDISDLIVTDTIQVIMSVVDYCAVWIFTYGTCAEHTPAPWFDNIRIYRYSTEGPQWYSRDLDLFQDNFPEEEFDIESVVRADAANDLNPNDDPVIRPGDSAVVNCTAPLAGGLAVEGNGEPAVFCHVLVTHMGPDSKTPPSGAVLQGDWGTYYSMDGSWTVIQMDTAISSAGNPLFDKYTVDLNDSLFTRGFRIDYYFKARDLDGNWSTLPERAQTHNTFFEFTCLPTFASDILYVDDFHGRGTLKGYVENYMDFSIRAVIPPDNQPDRYDVNNPSSLVGNGLGSRAKNFQLTTAYKKMMWDSGNLENGTICTGDPETSGKSPDCQVILDWMNLSPHEIGLWIMGDDIAFDLDNQAAACALDLMSNWCGVTLVHDSYYDLTGGRIAGGVTSPMVYTVPGTKWTNPMHIDSFWVDGGCAIINAFDVLGTTESSQFALKYPDYGGQPYYAGVQNELTNAADFYVKTMWFGFSFMYIRDAAIAPGVAMVRNRIMAAVRDWQGGAINDNITQNETPAAYSLSQNFPNPFNPSTTIHYSMRSKGHLSLKIYNVAGQLLRVLVDEVKNAGAYTIVWDGCNNRGSRVASGVYFYKMETKDFSRTKKMVMLR
jgi:hypothetical protein